jgi:hypothetical protein
MNSEHERKNKGQYLFISQLCQEHKKKAGNQKMDNDIRKMIHEWARTELSIKYIWNDGYGTIKSPEVGDNVVPEDLENVG